MSTNVLSSLSTQPSFTATNEVTGTTVWSKLGVESVEIQTASANTDAPISNVQVSESSVYQSLTEADIQSIKIVQPSRLRVVAYCSDLSTVINVISTLQDDTVTIAITTKSIITVSLVLVDVEIEQTPEMISASKVTMTFEQAQPASTSSYSPEQSADASVYGISITTPLSVTPLATLTKAVSSAVVSAANDFTGALIDEAGDAFKLDISKLA